MCCFSLNTNIQSSSGSDNISLINAGHKILNVDINSGETTETEILKTTKQTHLSLFKITTDTKQIEITPNHPLYIKDYGFISLGKVLNNMGLCDFSELINKIEILTWNEHTNQLEFQKLEGIELIRGNFDTYTILELSKGDTYIANGFVTKVYSK